MGSALQFRRPAAQPAEHRFGSKPHATQQHAEVHHRGHHEGVAGRHRRAITLDEADRKRHQRQRRQRGPPAEIGGGDHRPYDEEQQRDQHAGVAAADCE
ncbi:hypothetical protein G6F68_019705 [Rhizopus microsporus]|nr:hypothetical protein G6F68_019705 [Rhizopus microsporus]